MQLPTSNESAWTGGDAYENVSSPGKVRHHRRFVAFGSDRHRRRHTFFGLHAAVGPFAWIPITDASDAALPGAITITDTNGVTSVDARNTTNVAAFKGTDYQRPEDMQIQTLGGIDYLYVATTTTHEVYRVDLKNNSITLFANRNTNNLATNAAVSTAFSSPDNLAIDHDGNIYIVEDRGGGVDDDIWLANDLNKDGDLLDQNEGIGRWASNGTVGSEFTGLYFDPMDKRRAWVNIQHPDSDNDRTIEITISFRHQRHRYQADENPGPLGGGDRLSPDQPRETDRRDWIQRRKNGGNVQACVLLRQHENHISSGVQHAGDERERI